MEYNLKRRGVLAHPGPLTSEFVILERSTMTFNPCRSTALPEANASNVAVRAGLSGIRLLIVVLLVCGAMFVQAQDIAKIRQQERDVKVAIIFKLLRFVEWPEEHLQHDDPLKLCVWPDEPYTETFKEIEGSRVADHALFIEQLDTGKTAPCHVLFSSGEKRRSAAQWQSISDGKPILTISDVDNFAAHGGMIHLMKRDQRVVFSVNVEAMENAALRMSALVLNLAEIQQSNPALPQIQTRVENTNEQR